MRKALRFTVPLLVRLAVGCGGHDDAPDPDPRLRPEAFAVARREECTTEADGARLVDVEVGVEVHQMTYRCNQEESPVSCGSSENTDPNEP